MADLADTFVFLVFADSVFVSWPKPAHCPELKKLVGKMLQSTSIDFLIRIKNAYQAGHQSVATPSSNFCLSLAEILKKHHLVADYSVDRQIKKTLTVNLIYTNQKPAIEDVKIFSKPGRRWYERASSLPWGKSNQSLIIISTSQGLMSQRQAVKDHIGGELIAQIN